MVKGDKINYKLKDPGFDSQPGQTFFKTIFYHKITGPFNSGKQNIPDLFQKIKKILISFVSRRDIFSLEIQKIILVLKIETGVTIYVNRENLTSYKIEKNIISMNLNI